MQIKKSSSSFPLDWPLPKPLDWPPTKISSPRKKSWSSPGLEASMRQNFLADYILYNLITISEGVCKNVFLVWKVGDSNDQQPAKVWQTFLRFPPCYADNRVSII